ncbi:SLBB domain-containing protein [Sphingomonas sp.]|uniref:SLBB domain-containing protein n=1 Tax=Sphingomonas sp. TaxID=28214 RepID=UPI00286C3C31|nr:SLBB domain-containing protein [Sphingomonas sp.]
MSKSLVKLLFGAAALLSAGGASGQVMPVDPRYVPQGSPVSPNAVDQRQVQVVPNQGALGTTDPQSDLTIRADSVVDTERQLLLNEQLLSARRDPDRGEIGLKLPPKPNEFERYVERVIGRKLPRFGTNLLLPSQRDFATPATATVPPDYILNVGDVVSIAMAGSIEGGVEREIDTNGRIFLPKVGGVQLAGIRYGDLQDRVSAAIGRQYRGFTVNVGIRRLRGIRVYVTGFANHPGAFTVSSLSTMANAVFQAGGPSSGGSFRSIKLYRRGAEVADFDIYQLVRGGNRVGDAVLQNEDVLFIPPTGPQVAVIGSVNEEAIYETKPGETLDTVLALAGGTNDLGDSSRVILYRTARTDRIGPQEIRREALASADAMGGDIVQILSSGSLIQPVDRQSVLVRVEGEVNRPGNYYVAPNTPMSQVMDLAGGLTPRAYAFGTKLTRQSVKVQQREGFLEAIKQLELTLASAPLTADQSIPAAQREAELSGARAVLDRLRIAEPDGRVVMQIAPGATALPATVLLENNDSINVPVRASTVGVFGAVYRPASFLIDEYARPLRVRNYLDKSGGPLRAADRRGIFVVRANGEVLPRSRGALNAAVLPGDVVFVPVKTQSSSFWAKLRDISAVLFQAGVGAAAIGSVVK